MPFCGLRPFGRRVPVFQGDDFLGALEHSLEGSGVPGSPGVVLH